jgi:excisionase family DNA binding protein
MTEEYLTVQQVAERLQVTRQAVYNWINEGRLKAVKAGRATRIPVSALNAFLKPHDQSEKGE